jgi:hypothetical protein
MNFYRVLYKLFIKLFTITNLFAALKCVGLASQQVNDGKVPRVNNFEFLYKNLNSAQSVCLN